MSRRTSSRGRALFAVALLVFLTQFVSTASGDQAEKSLAQTRPTLACEVTGEARLTGPLTIYSRAAGGRALARLTGAPVKISVADFPRRAAGARARVRTAPRGEGLSVSGFASVGPIQFVTRDRGAIVPGHVWLEAGEPVFVTRAASKRLEVRARLAAPLDQEVTVRVHCADLALDPMARESTPVPGEARGYAARGRSLGLFDRPEAGAQPVFTLRRAEASSAILFFSTESRGDWVRVRLAADVVVDAWARAADLDALPEGETMDQLAPPDRDLAPQLQLEGKPEVLLATELLPLRIRATKRSSPVGTIQPNTRLYAIDQVAGWISVLPTSLSMTAPDGGPFWISEAALRPR